MQRLKSFQKLILFHIALLAVLLLPATSSQVSAAGAALSAGSAEVQQGGAASITLNISGNPGMSALVITPQSDNTKITFSSASNGNIFGALTTGSNLVFDSSADSRANGTLCTVRFQVSRDLAPGTYRVSFVARGGTNANGDNITVSSATGTIKVTCASHNYGSWSAVTNPSCTSGGKQQRRCSACGYTETQNTNPIGHAWSDYKETKAATCTEKGTKTRTCSKCNQTESASIPSIGHSYDHTKETKAPTCTEKGEKTGTCKKCGQKISESIPATGHEFGDWKQVTAPTFSEAGSEKRTCKKCDAEETRSVASLGYAFSEPTASKKSVFVYYDVTSVISQDELEEKGSIAAKFSVPSSAGSDILLYFVTENGTFEVISATLSKDGTYIEAQLTKLGTYAIGKTLSDDVTVDVAEIPNTDASNAGSDDTAKSDSPLAIVFGILSAVEFLVIIGYVGYRLKTKKRVEA